MNEKEKQLDLIINKNNLVLKQNVMFDRVVEERFQKILELNKKIILMI